MLVPCTPPHTCSMHGVYHGPQVQLQGDGIPGDLSTAHPKLLRDGRTLVNFTRSIPAGGFHVYKQDAKTLERKQIAFIR